MPANQAIHVKSSVSLLSGRCDDLLQRSSKLWACYEGFPFAREFRSSIVGWALAALVESLATSTRSVLAKDGRGLTWDIVERYINYYKLMYEVDESVWNGFLVLDNLNYCQSMTLRQLILKFLPALHLMNEVPSTLDLGSGVFRELANDWQLSVGGRISRHAVGSSGRMCQHSVSARFVELSQRV